MDKRRRFRPADVENLERRAVLDVAGSSSAVFAQALSRTTAVRQTRLSRSIDEINGSYDRFSSDYLQAQAAFLASDAAFLPQFQAVTNQRVNLLAQELTPALARLPGSLARKRGQSEVPLQTFLRTRINGGTDTSLRSILDRVAPKQNVDDDAAKTLFTLAAQNAIEASRVNTLNAARLLASGRFNERRHD